MHPHSIFRLSLMVVLLWAASGPSTASAQAGSIQERSFTHGDSLRSYLLYVPAAYDAQDSEAWPLVIDYHGYSIDGAFQMAVDQLDLVADTAHFLLAYPQGLIVDDPFDGPDRGWNFDGKVSTNDDVAFTSALIDHVAADYRVDPQRVHATGWSMGSQMIWGVACGLSDRIASVAGVSGPMDDAFMETCDPGRPYAAMLIHGTEDLYWPPEGVDVNGYSFADPQATTAFWAQHSQCDPEPTVTDVADLDPNDGSTVTRMAYGGCAAGTEVVHYRIEDGGHTWPSGGWPGGGPTPDFLGSVNRDLDASAEIWSFFARNPKPAVPDGTLTERSLMHGDSLRSYLLYVPAAYDGSEPWPLILNYHGLLTSSSFQVELSQMNAVADTAHVLVAYPQGLEVAFSGFPTGAGWNVPGPATVPDGIAHDDIAFTDALIDHVRGNFSVDPARIHATGWSNGSIMSFYLACEASDQIASVAGVAAPMSEAILAECAYERPVSTLFMHGTADPIAPFDGLPGLFASATATTSFWVGQFNCAPDPLVTELPDVVTTDTSTVTRFVYEDCDGDIDVEFYRVNDGGHTWPGGGTPTAAAPLGPTNRDMNASAEILAFFARNPHPEGASGQESPLPADAQLELLASDLSFGEGPLWHPDGYLLYTELNADRVMRFDPQTLETTVFLEPTGTPNGLAFDMDQRLVMCRRDQADIARLEADGSITVLTSAYDGTTFNGPNDITIRSDNVIFFTDPNRTSAPDRSDGVYALHPDGRHYLIDPTLNFANGITLSPAEDRLYVNAARDQMVYVYERQGDSTYANRQPFASIPEARYLDGMKTDRSGRLYVTGGGGLWIYSPEGALLDFVPMEGNTTNLNWGDGDYRTLYVTQVEALHRVRVDAVGFVSVGADPDTPLPGRTPLLLDSFPNPFRDRATLTVQSASPGPARVEVFDLLGRRRAVLFEGPLSTEPQRLTFDAGALPSGVYLVRLQTPAGVQVRQLVRVR